MTDGPPLDVYLRRAAGALEVCFLRLTAIDAEFGGASLPQAGAQAATCSAILQELDRATQEVAGITRFLEDLATSVQTGQALDGRALTMRQTLDDLGARLRGQATEAARSQSSDCEIF